ncbi:uncharacterized protein KY384_004375 [Bacidia gigantensis]|uniref:uncharacterized protein n=1 Tax=Bacidia gigantensis TaxID=2732470 RepID=UPI001D05178A|nr:uncharacterized protein KY384_004375 [Bacidia gigantensis]KAG8531018.1 hypothetical protein KY384_004375 [Bacidia gigantensis]
MIANGAVLVETSGLTMRNCEVSSLQVLRSSTDLGLPETLKSGVAYHHAGLEMTDRASVEKGFLEGQINVICCTSTLAVGVNLPCHFVIIKNTVNYQDNGVQEYSDLEIMQMLGRAGRPQFDDSAVAVILTKQEKVQKYEKLISGQEVLESCLHSNLIDHLNAEIGLGTILSLQAAKRWLSGTFLYVRLEKNPGHYRIDGDVIDQSVDDRVELICKRELELLHSAGLISVDVNGDLRATEFGDAMARYYVRFETMKMILGLGSQPKLSDILSAIVQADEYHDIRLRGNEKKLFKELNRQQGIRFPIKVDLAMHAHKRSLIVQSELGSVDFPADEGYGKLKVQFLQEKHRLFSNIHRLLRCVIDCQIHVEDAVGVRNALELARSLGARVWDNSPFQMKQLPQIGAVAVRKLAVGGIANIEALEAAEPHKIESLLSRNPPFGSRLLTSIQAFPKLRVSVKMIGKDPRTGEAPAIRLKVELGFMNESPPNAFRGKPIHICLIAARSDGLLIDFRRIPAKKIGHGVDMLLTAPLTNQSQFVTIYVMCDEIAGTLRYAELKPKLALNLFPLEQVQQSSLTQTKSGRATQLGGQAPKVLHDESSATLNESEFDDDIDDQDLQKVADASVGTTFNNIDDFKETGLNKRDGHANWKPERLRNGKWACNHSCKNKFACKHLCCREGLDKAPKPPKNATGPAASALEYLASGAATSISQEGKKQSKLATKVTSVNPAGNIEMLDLRSPVDQTHIQSRKCQQIGKLEQLHRRINKDVFSNDISQGKLEDGSNKEVERQAKHTVRGMFSKPSEQPSSIYSDDWANSLPSVTEVLDQEDRIHTGSPEGHTDGRSAIGSLANQDSSTRPEFDEPIPEPGDTSEHGGESDTEEALFGLEDSILMQSNADDGSTPQMRAQQHSSGLDASEKLFLSTDSPERLSTPIRKRKADDVDIRVVHELSPERKRARAEEDDRKASTPRVDPQSLADMTIPVIKPGLPAWVYEFDPALVVEYQDIVDQQISQTAMSTQRPSGGHPSGERLLNFVQDSEGPIITRFIAGRSKIPGSLRGCQIGSSSSDTKSRGTSRLVEGSNYSQYGSLPCWSDGTGTDSVTESIDTSFGEETLNESFRVPYIDAGTWELPAYPPSRRTPVLQCPFEILGCRREFPKEDESAWIEHSLDHFVTNDASRQRFAPPKDNSCCFCQKLFQYEDGTVSWRQRMMHIAAHHRLGHSLAHAQPNFSLLIYLWQKRVIDDETFRDIHGKTPDRSRIIANASPPVTEPDDEEKEQEDEGEEEEEEEESDTETVTNINDGRRNRARRPGA